jgi:putative membrane protein
MLMLTPGFLLVAGSLMVAAHLTKVPTVRFWAWFVPVSVLTFAVEVLGVSTGLVFGPYHYTSVLGPSLAGVPLLIGLNWVLVVLGSLTAVRAFVKGPWWLRALLAGVGCMAFDLLLEPVAVHLGYWVWDVPSIPLQNYLAWGLIGAAAASWAELADIPGASTTLAWYTVIQTVFFAGIDVWILLGWIP